MKKKHLCLSAVLTFALTTAAAALTPSFTVEPQISVHIGHWGEHLYVNDTTVENPQKSYLNWEFHPMWMAGIHGNISFSRFFLAAQFNAGLPVTIGYMQDSDWFDLTNVKQSFSEGINNLQEAWYTDALLGYEFFPAEWLSLAPIAGFSYHFVKMTSPEGATGYTDPNPDDGIIVPYDSEGAYLATTAQIDYWRETIQLHLGVQAKFFITDWFTVNTKLAVAPVTNILSVDHHYNHSYGFYIDKPFGFFHAFFTEADAQFRLHEHIVLTAGVKLNMLFVITGDTYISNKQGYLGTKQSNYHAGASETDCTIRIGLAFTF